MSIPLNIISACLKCGYIGLVYKDKCDICNEDLLHISPTRLFDVLEEIIYTKITKYSENKLSLNINNIIKILKNISIISNLLARLGILFNGSEDILFDGLVKNIQTIDMVRYLDSIINIIESGLRIGYEDEAEAYLDKLEGVKF